MRLKIVESGGRLVDLDENGDVGIDAVPRPRPHDGALPQRAGLQKTLHFEVRCLRSRLREALDQRIDLGNILSTLTLGQLEPTINESKIRGIGKLQDA